MVLYDASVLIDYLAGDEDVVGYVERHASQRSITVPLVLYEIYEGEIFRTGTTDFDALDGRLGWLDVVETDRHVALAAGELQNELEAAGAYLAPRDAFIAGAAQALSEPLATRDSDFDGELLRDHVDVDLL